jgi:chemotaxis protein histidine kinase CheA
MSDLHHQFLESSIQTLFNLKTDLQAEEIVSERFLHQAFRQIHTIKGTAQTFGFIKSANIAHNLENLLSDAGKIIEENERREILIEGLSFLIESLENKHFEIPPDFARKLQKFAPETETSRGAFFSIVPPEVFEQLNEFEKNKLTAALNDNKFLYRINVLFDYATFSEGFKSFQNVINEKGEIIFTLPAETGDSSDGIGFQIYFASRETEENLPAAIKDYKASLVSLNSPQIFADDLSGVLSQIAAQGKKLARNLGKNVEIEVLTNETELPPQALKLIFDVLLHLVKNSIDHSIEKEGKVEIRLREENGSLKITVADDGKGVDLEKVRARALEKNLIAPAALSDEREMLELLFLPGFSTAEKVTDISGRGVGLDAVRDLVTNTGGAIGIESQKGRGTTFEIFLPLNGFPKT